MKCGQTNAQSAGPLVRLMATAWQAVTRHSRGKPTYGHAMDAGPPQKPDGPKLTLAELAAKRERLHQSWKSAMQRRDSRAFSTIEAQLRAVTVEILSRGRYEA